MRLILQHLRDEAEHFSVKSAELGDKESADAWERIGIKIDAMQHDIKHDWATIVASLGIKKIEELEKDFYQEKNSPFLSIIFDMLTATIDDMGNTLRYAEKIVGSVVNNYDLDKAGFSRDFRKELGICLQNISECLKSSSSVSKTIKTKK